MTGIPPLRRLEPAPSESESDARITVVAGSDAAVARAFGALLLDSRADRGLPAANVELFVSREDSETLPPTPAVGGRMWAPHLIAVAPEDEPTLVWELADPAMFETALEAPARDIAVWANQPHALLRLAALARPSDSITGEYLSLRWLMAHQGQAASAASAGVAFEHVSIHATPAEMDRVRGVLRDALGLVEIPRPSTISIPGHWLAAGEVRVHLNAREGVAPAAAGTAPNHICFAVANLEAVKARVEALGFACQEAGSLGDQIWFRLQSGTVLELQRRRRAQQD